MNENPATKLINDRNNFYFKMLMYCTWQGRIIIRQHATRQGKDLSAIDHGLMITIIHSVKWYIYYEFTIVVKVSNDLNLLQWSEVYINVFLYVTDTVKFMTFGVKGGMRVMIEAQSSL
jgi:hypothetical protein